MGEAGGMLSGEKRDVRHRGPGRVRNGLLLVMGKAGSKDTRTWHGSHAQCAVGSAWTLSP